ncbi:tyrosine-type recombinase/integrase [Aminobacter sp. BE322]|uniref:tyrosine-type recombinase/integrase n=1 Tax=unclassified Aminobacter TaxID=2644704 RepID=UPI003D1AA7BF
MPTPELRPAENGTFYAFWSENRRSRRKSMGTKDLAVAETRFGQWLALGGHKGQVSQEGRVGLTIAELWHVYDVKHVQKETAAPASIEYAWANLKPHFGALTPGEIDQTTAEDYGDARGEGRIGRPAKSSTVRKELAALRACLNWHAAPERGRRKLLEHTDLPIFKLPEEADPRDRWLTTAEIKAMLAAAKALHPGAERMTRGERFLWLALETAARKQAILDLTWGRVDFETNVIHYAVPGKKQTKKRRPSVPISRALRPVLEAMHKERAGDLVLDHDGEVWATIQAIVVKAGLAPKLPRGTGERIKSTGISPHTLRHTAATQMARRGVPLYDIAGILGNTLAMVEKVYAKHCPGRLQAAVNSISGTLEAAE